MASFDDQLTNDFDKIFLNTGEFAQTVIYRSQDDWLTEISIDVIFNDAYEQVNVAENFIATTDPHIFFRRAALGITPQIGDEVEISGKSYAVSNIQEDSTGGVRIYLTEKDEC